MRGMVVGEGGRSSGVLLYSVYAFDNVDSYGRPLSLKGFRTLSGGCIHVVIVFSLFFQVMCTWHRRASCDFDMYR